MVSHASFSPSCKRRSNLVRTLFHGLVAGFLLTTAGLVTAQDSTAPDRTDNAALDYWRAIALLREPTAPEDLKTLSIVNNEVPNYPPGVFGVRPGAGRWLLSEQPALLALQDGSRKEHCDFNVRTSGRQALNMEHLVPLRRLAQRALQSAKAYEYADNPQGAAAIYVALFRLVEHLDQDQSIASGFFAAELMQDVLSNIAGFVSRSPSAADLSALTAYFASAPSTLFHLDQYLKTTAEHSAAWIADDVEKAEARLDSLYGDAPHKPGVEQLMTLSEEDKTERLQLWIDGFLARMNALADACTKPYQVGLYQLIDLDKEKEADLKSPTKAENPLMPLLVPTMEKAYERFLLGEAHFVMADILCSAALYHHDLNAWPPDLEALAKFVGRDFRRDPFSGAHIQYKLKRRMPIIGIRAPKWLAKDADNTFRITLASRRADDLVKTARLQKELISDARREKMRELQQDAVPVGR